jgi:DNA-binding GntR family transcriptional regulator
MYTRCISRGENLPIKEESRSDKLYREIRDRICLLQYPPGTVLKEEALASEFGVSRTPVRRVLQRLEFERLVDINQRSGAIVTTVDLKSLKEVYALRLKLVELTGELARNRVPNGMIPALESLLERCEAFRDQYDPEGLAQLYNSFHDEMLRVIGNQALREFSDQLFHQTARVWLQILPDLDWEAEVDIMCEEIRDVLAALQAVEMQTVAQIRRDHMSLLLGRINNYLGSADIG